MSERNPRIGLVWTFLARHMLEVVLVAVCVFLAIRAPGFLSIESLTTILRSVAPWGLIAFGMTMVIVAGEIDLSVGSAVAFAACLIAWLVNAGVPVPVALVISVAVGGLCGAFTGLMRSVFQVPSFITSLALLAGLRGGALLISGGFTLTPFPSWYSFLGSGYVAGIPVPVIVFTTVFVAVHVLMNHTPFGRAVYAVGGNAEAARLSGINVGTVRVAVLAVTGMLAAISAVMLSARAMAGNPTEAEGWELDIIAAVIIGGTSLTGGVGSAWGTLVGVIFIGVIVTGMTLLDVPSDNQFLVRGAIILAAVLMNQLQQRKPR